MPNLDGTPPGQRRQTSKRRLTASLLVISLFSAATIVGAYGLVLHIDDVCGESRCEKLGIKAQRGALEEPQRESHEGSDPILQAEAGPAVSCTRHSKDPAGCTATTLDVREDNDLTNGIEFVFSVIQDDNASAVLGTVELDALSTPALDTLAEDGVSLPAARESVEVWAEILYSWDQSTQVLPIDNSWGSENVPVEHRGTGEHTWTFREEHLVGPKLTGQYVITFFARSADGAAQSAPAVVTVVGDAPPQLQAVGSLPILREGLSHTYEVELAGSPGGKPVVWAITSSSPRVTVFPSSVTLDAAGLSGRVPITLSAPADDVARGDETVTILHSHSFNQDPADWNEWRLDNFITTVHVRDDDEAGFNVLARNNTVREGGGANVVSISLASEPMTDIRVEARMEDVAGSSVSPRYLHFGPSNWTEPQQTFVRFAPDGTPGNIRTYGLAVRAVHPSSTQQLGTDYLHAPTKDIPITVIDDDSILLRPFQGTLLLVDEHMEGGQITITPLIRPESTVIINMASSDSNAVRPTPSRLTFTPSNWSLPQTVHMGLVPDNAGAGDRSAVVSFTVDAESAPSYRATKALAVTVEVRDNDPQASDSSQGAGSPPAPVILGAPTDLTAELFGHEVSLEWRAASGDPTPAFAVWRYPGGHIVETVSATSTAAQTYTELMPGPAHRYAVQAVTGTSRAQFDEALATDWVIVMRPGALDAVCMPGMPDADQDGLCDLFEKIVMTSPTNADTDGDGVSDYDEIMTAKTDPLDPRSFPAQEIHSTSGFDKSTVVGISAVGLLALVGATLVVVVLVRRGQSASASKDEAPATKE